MAISFKETQWFTAWCRGSNTISVYTVWFCGAYQRTECKHSDTHISEVIGKDSITPHVCASYWLKDKIKLSHASASADCSDHKPSSACWLLKLKLFHWVRMGRYALTIAWWWVGNVRIAQGYNGWFWSCVNIWSYGIQPELGDLLDYVYRELLLHMCHMVSKLYNQEVFVSDDRVWSNLGQFSVWIDYQWLVRTLI